MRSRSQSVGSGSAFGGEGSVDGGVGGAGGGAGGGSGGSGGGSVVVEFSRRGRQRIAKSFGDEFDEVGA